MTAFERWAAKVEITDSCWLWTASKFENGYGYFQNKKAHRVGYEFFKGEIPSGLEPDHLCRVRACVNPNHLEAVTHQINSLRAKHGKPCPHGNIVKRNCKPCRAEVLRRLRARRRA